MLVASPSTREILAHIAIGHALGSVHQHLGTIIELWSAVDGEQEGECLLQCQGILAFSQESVGVMVLDECHHALWIWIEIIVAEHVVDAIHTIPPIIGLLVLGTIDAVEEGEVHHGRQIAVLLGEFAILLPSGGIGWLGNPSLAHGIEVWILVVKHFHPVRHRITVGVWVGVHADAVDAHGLYPPLAVLYQVLDDVWVALVEIWHAWHKPSIHRLMQIHLASVWVEHWSQLIVGLQVLVVDGSAAIHRTNLLLVFCSLILRRKPFRGIEPVLRWHIGHPRMLETTVIEDHIHHHLQALLVSLSDELLVLGIGTEARIYPIIVGSGVTMVSTVLAIVRTVVLQDWRKPQCGNAQLVEIVEMLTDTLQVTTMTKTWRIAVASLVTHRLHHVVLWIAIGKTVWHQHIEHILIAETDALIASHLTVLQEIFYFLRLFALFEVKGHLSRLRPIEVQINQEIVR